MGTLEVMPDATGYTSLDGRDDDVTNVIVYRTRPGRDFDPADLTW